jgi:CTP:molybdopterin cytidylyltransferase MocA
MGLRMGGPKALLRWVDGEPLATAHSIARTAECGRTLIVTRQSIADKLGAQSGGATVLVSTEADELGPAGSIATAVRSGLLQDVNSVLIVPVDTPVAATTTVCALFGALDCGARAARPIIHPAASGHPVACAMPELVQFYGPGARRLRPLREVLDELGEGCADVTVEDPSILVDFDTRDAFESASGVPVRFWNWP